MPEDLNGDGNVDAFDLSILLSNWGTDDATADINSDGTVDAFDLSMLLNKWGDEVATGGLPPSPTAWPGVAHIGMASGAGGASSMLNVAPFGFRYQYLAGGANTGNGWATWNAGGEFVTYYIDDSRQAGILPVFTYYMIYQSNPGSSQGEPTGVFTNLSSASTMNSYFQDLKLFFQKASADGEFVGLHVEPDLWGFMQQQVDNNDAATIAVQVASSGMTDVAGFADNGAGLAQAIVHLRDLYAPNVMLGYHFSPWGTGTDIIYSDPPDSTVVSLGEQTAEFYNSLNADFDVAFHDLSDRDAGFKEYVYGDGGGSWMDAGDYHRSALYINTFVVNAGLRVVLWQLPYGNTVMRACNNTTGHYQDNRVETIIGDQARTQLLAYTEAGVLAFLFGGGAGGVTSPSDIMGDGVTNPEPINGNDRMSLSADDDGGYFDEQAALYYQNGADLLP